MGDAEGRCQALARAWYRRMWVEAARIGCEHLTRQGGGEELSAAVDPPQPGKFTWKVTMRVKVEPLAHSGTRERADASDVGVGAAALTNDGYSISPLHVLLVGAGAVGAGETISLGLMPDRKCWWCRSQTLLVLKD